MKDQYVGDVNDYAKYQLLRICAKSFEPVIVAWMLTEGDGGNDGEKLSYLEDLELAAADPELFSGLAELVSDNGRSTAAVEKSGILPGCMFHSGPMPHDEAGRRTYFEVLAELASAESLLFLDPDNGLEVASVAAGSRNSERYLYWGELSSLALTGTSLLVYQHFPRVQRAEYLRELLERIEEKAAGLQTFAAYTSHVGFLFAIRPEPAPALRDAVRKLCTNSPLLSFIE